MASAQKHRLEMLAIVHLCLLSASPIDLARRAVAAGDSDGDGKLSAAEFESRIQHDSALADAAFAALDLDRDGKLDAEPFEQALERPSGGGGNR